MSVPSGPMPNVVSDWLTIMGFLPNQSREKIFDTMIGRASHELNTAERAMIHTFDTLPKAWRAEVIRVTMLVAPK